MLLATRTRLPLVVCGPDGGAILAAAAGVPLFLIGVRELERPDAIADARLAAALGQGLLCVDGLENLSPTERAILLRALDESPERIVLLAARRSDAIAVSDRATLLVEVPDPSSASAAMPGPSTPAALTPVRWRRSSDCRSSRSKRRQR